MSVAECEPSMSAVSRMRLELDQWKESLEKALRESAKNAAEKDDMKQAETAVRELLTELGEMQKHLQATADTTALLMKDSILLSDESLIRRAERHPALEGEELQVALRAHARQVQCRNHEGQPWPLWQTTSEQLKVYGTGIQLFFRFKACVVCLVLAAVLLSLPIIFANANGSSLSAYRKDAGWLIMTTAGNLGTQSFAFGRSTWQVTEVTHFCGILDATIALLIYLSACWFELRVIPQVVRNEHRNMTSPAAFAVYVDCLPRLEEAEHQHYKKLLVEHFETLLRAEVTPASAAAGLAVVAASAEPNNEAPGGSLVHQVVLVRDFSRRRMEDGEEPKPPLSLPVLGAFVVFKRVVHRDFLHDHEYRFSRYLLGRALQNQRLRFRGSSIRIQEAPAPCDVCWDNMDFPTGRRYLRKGLLVLVCVFLLLVCIAVLAAGKNTSTRAREERDALSCSDQATEEEVRCQCSRVGYSKVLEDQPPGIYDQCFAWLKEVTYVTSLTTVGSVVSCIVNLGIGYLVEYLAQFVKPTSVTSLELTIMRTTFVFTSLTLGVVTTLVNAKFNVSLFGIGGILGLVGNGEHEDFDPLWFAVVGSQVMSLNLYCMFSPVLSVALQGPLFHLYCWWCSGKQTTWKDFQELYTPPRFPFAVQHAEVLSAMFVTLVFSSGMPALTVLLFLRLSLHEVADRHILLRGSRRPARYTHHLALAMSRWLQVAVMLHAAVAVWIYGNPSVYPSYRMFSGGEDGSTLRDAFGKIKGQGLVGQFVDRSLQASAFPNACVLLVLSTIEVLDILKFALGRSVKDAFGTAWRRCLVGTTKGATAPRTAVPTNDDVTFDQRPLQEMRRNGVVHSYEPLELPQYAHALKMASETCAASRYKWPAASGSFMPGSGDDQDLGSDEGGPTLQPVPGQGSTMPIRASPRYSDIKVAEGCVLDTE